MSIIKKILKIILITILVLIVLIVGGIVALLTFFNYRNDNYFKYAETGGEIEKKYSALGDYEVEYIEFDAENDTWKMYEVWYPANMKRSEEKYPLVIMANGTGIKASQYQAVFEHLASWGFIVVGNEDENSRTGASSAATLDFMLAQNQLEESPFYGKIDVENIGIAGHSQGGVGAINAATAQENSSYYTAIFTASTTSNYWGQELVGGNADVDRKTKLLPDAVFDDMCRFFRSAE